mgnify:FL=1
MPLQAVNVTIKIAARAKGDRLDDIYYTIPSILDLHFMHSGIYHWMDANGYWVSVDLHNFIPVELGISCVSLVTYFPPP